jgi:hypothetical protein
MKKVLFAVICSLFCLTACSKKEETTLTEVQVRVKNMSNMPYTDLTVIAGGGGQQNYGTVNSKALSDYKTYKFCYRYGFVQLKIDGKLYTLQPFDYVGETKFESGKFTYEIDANVINNTLSLNFVKD